LGDNSDNSRNGTTPKTLRGKRGQVQIDVPRDRTSEFEPQLVRKGQTRFDGLDEKIISLYARGMTQREIQGHLEEIYGVEVSPSLISTVTDAVLDEVRAWQSRPLDAVYPILYLDALQVKVKSQGRVSNKAIYIAFGVNLQGLKEVLGMWAAENEGAKFWMQIVTELKNRGVSDIFIACVGGLKGFPEAIEAVYPQTQVQLCMVHMVRHSLSYVSHKDRKAVATDLKAGLPGGDAGRGGAATHAVRGGVGGELPGHRPFVALELVAGGADVRLPGGDQAGDLHDEHDRVVEHDLAEGDEESLAVPERRGGLQADVPGAEEHQQEVDNADQELERRDEPVRYFVRGTSADGGLNSNSLTQNPV
jgi:transposase-like protein